MNKQKQILAILAISAFSGGIMGSFLFGGTSFVQAGILEDFFEQYVKPLFPAGAAPEIPKIIKEEKREAKNGESPPIYASVSDYENAVIKAVEASSPSVISIIISKDLPVIEQCPYDFFGDLPQEFRQFFGQDIEFYRPCQKGVKRQEVGGGSGFIISSDGLIVTNKHVVGDVKASYTVLLNDARKYEAKILAQDSARDFAVIKINVENLPVVRLGDSDSIKLGQTAIAIGNALGEFRNTVSVGVISGLARTITASGGGLTERIEGVIQTDAAINQGNSGGPLLNLKGEVIGINVAMVSGAQNIGFAIPVNQVKKAIESVKKTGRIVTPYLGIRYLLITPESAKKEKLPVDYGILIRGGEDGPGVMKNSPAEKAGLLAEDVILELNGEKITLEKSFGFLLGKYSVGDEVALKILRSGKETEIKVKLEERP